MILHCLVGKTGTCWHALLAGGSAGSGALAAAGGALAAPAAAAAAAAGGGGGEGAAALAAAPAAVGLALGTPSRTLQVTSGWPLRCTDAGSRSSTASLDTSPLHGIPALGPHLHSTPGGLR